MNNIIIIVITMIINIMIMPKVLSYMEDHLKNKQRLEQEWVGLCAYEAEPNSTAIAFKVVSLSMLMLIISVSVMSLLLLMLILMLSCHLQRLVTGGEQEEEPLPGQAAVRSQPG